MATDCKEYTNSWGIVKQQDACENCEAEYNDEKTWLYLIEFVELYLKVQQQRILIQHKWRNKKRCKNAKKMSMLGDRIAVSLVTQEWKQSAAFSKKRTNIL